MISSTILCRSPPVYVMQGETCEFLLLLPSLLSSRLSLPPSLPPSLLTSTPHHRLYNGSVLEAAQLGLGSPEAAELGKEGREGGREGKREGRAD